VVRVDDLVALLEIANVGDVCLGAYLYGLL